MQRFIWSIVAATGLLLAAGCGSNGGGGNNVNQPLGNSFQAIANQRPNNESLAVTDPNALQQSLLAAFGQPNDESRVIDDNQTVADLAN